MNIHTIQPLPKPSSHPTMKCAGSAPNSMFRLNKTSSFRMTLPQNRQKEAFENISSYIDPSESFRESGQYDTKIPLKHTNLKKFVRTFINQTGTSKRPQTSVEGIKLWPKLEKGSLEGTKNLFEKIYSKSRDMMPYYKTSTSFFVNVSHQAEPTTLTSRIIDALEEKDPGVTGNKKVRSILNLKTLTFNGLKDPKQGSNSDRPNKSQNRKRQANPSDRYANKYFNIADFQHHMASDLVKSAPKKTSLTNQNRSNIYSFMNSKANLEGQEASPVRSTSVPRSNSISYVSLDGSWKLGLVKVVPKKEDYMMNTFRTTREAIPEESGLKHSFLRKLSQPFLPTKASRNTKNRRAPMVNSQISIKKGAEQRNRSAFEKQFNDTLGSFHNDDNNEDFSPLVQWEKPPTSSQRIPTFEDNMQ